MTIRVGVVDDQELVRHGFAVLISLADDMEIVGEAGNGHEALDLVRRRRPDVVLMDIHMPEMDGLEATRRIVAHDGADGCRVLILTTFDADEYVFDALRSGASGFLLKDTSPPELLNAVRVIAAGDALLDPKITGRLIEQFASSAAADPGLTAAVDHLTEREAEVLREIAGGRSNVEIGEELHMSYGTVKTHVSRLLTKLACRDRAQLVMVAYESGFVTPGDGAD